MNNTLDIYNVKVVAELAFPSKLGELFDAHPKFSFESLENSLRLKLKENGLLVFSSNSSIEAINTGKFRTVFEYKTFNINFIPQKFVKKSPRSSDASKIEDFVTEVFAKLGLSAKFSVFLGRDISSNEHEYITSPPFPGEKERTPPNHFHLVILNQSGRGSTSVYGAGENGEHHHIVDGAIVSPAVKKGKEIEGSHRHAICRFVTGFYDSGPAIPNQEKGVFKHKHIDIRLDQFGNGVMEAIKLLGGKLYPHTHVVQGGIVLPANSEHDKHTHQIKLLTLL